MNESGDSSAPPELLYDALVATRAFIENPTPENRQRSGLAVDKVRVAERKAAVTDELGRFTKLTTIFRQYFSELCDIYLANPTDRNKAIINKLWEIINLPLPVRPFDFERDIYRDTYKYSEEKLPTLAVGRLLRLWRILRGLTREQVIQLISLPNGHLRISISRLSRIERGEQDITVDELTLLIILYKVPEAQTDILKYIYVGGILSEYEINLISKMWYDPEKHRFYLGVSQWLIRINEEIRKRVNQGEMSAASATNMRNTTLAPVRHYLNSPSEINEFRLLNTFREFGITRLDIENYKF